MSVNTPNDSNRLLFFLALAVVVTAARIVTIMLTDASLGQDETQYWYWSETPAWGYFSKPPFIAWSIAATTALFGDAEWAVRLSAPFFHLGAATFLFFLARRLAGETVAFWTALVWLTIPGVWLSSFLIATDAPLLFFWSAALYLFHRLANCRNNGGQPWTWALALGGAIGLGMLSKYAMIYFIVSAGLALLASRSLRKQIRLSDIAIIAVTAGVIVAPNAAWNAAHDFQTLAHTASNANWGGALFHPIALAEFLGAQFGVFGPILFGLLIWSGIDIWANADRKMRQQAIFLGCFILPPLLIVSTQAFISRAHANWAAAAYPAATILIVAWAFDMRKGLLIRLSTFLHAFLGAGFLLIMTNFALADALGLSDAVKPIRGWKAHGPDINGIARGYAAIVVDDREIMGAVLYYARGGTPVFALNSNNKIDNHYEAFLPFNRATPRALFVTDDPQAPAVSGLYQKVTLKAESTAALNSGQTHSLYLFEITGPVSDAN